MLKLDDVVKLRPGTKLICIDNTNRSDLIVGKVYTVVKVYLGVSPEISVEEYPDSSLYAKRFILANQSKIRPLKRVTNVRKHD